jgi:hypothetical protein
MMRFLGRWACVLLLMAMACGAVAQKLPIRGLTAMGSPKSEGGSGGPDNSMHELFVHAGMYRGAVINVLWKQLEPKVGVFDFSSIDAGMKNVAKYNAQYPATPAVAKLRVFVGADVPAWLMPLTHGPLTVGHKGESESFAGWWTPAYRAEWKKLNDALAAKYDADPLMGEVAAASCATFTDESFIYPHAPEMLKTLHAAGFTDAAEKACLMGAVEDYSGWTKTPLDLTFSPYEAGDSGTAVRDDSFTLAVMKEWREKLGARGVISNHSLQSPVSPPLVLIYAQLKEVGPPIELQTASEGVIEHGKEQNGQPGAARDKSLPPFMDWNQVIQNGIDIGAGEIEIWTTVEGGGHAKISSAMLKAWAAKLE